MEEGSWGHEPRRRNLISLAINGKTISDNLQEGLDSLNKTFDNVNDIHLARPLD